MPHWTNAAFNCSAVKHQIKTPLWGVLNLALDGKNGDATHSPWRILSQRYGTLSQQRIPVFDAGHVHSEATLE